MEALAKRRIKDGFRLGSTYACGTMGILVLLSIFLYVLINGSSLLSWDLLSKDYHSETLSFEGDGLSASSFVMPEDAGSAVSSSWGIAFDDEKDLVGNDVVVISYLDVASPLRKLTTNEGGYLNEDNYFTKAFFLDESGNNVLALAKEGAATVATNFEKGKTLTSLSITTEGGGIRGSLLSSLLLLGMSLLLALPLGISSAIFFTYFAPKKRYVIVLERMIEVTAGIPSIIFGLLGVAVFIPICDSLFFTQGASLLAGSFTMAVILLPTIVKTSEEALQEVPTSYRTSALALGSSERQTLYRVILPSALPGLLSGAVLSAGRIIGESAALVYASSAYIADYVSLNKGSATLAVEIWTLMAGENPNYRLASAISIVILLIVTILSLTAKVLSRLYLRKKVAL
jgi:phosphate transport system permease protein